MSWFKNTAGDPIAMSNSNFDKRPVREPLNDPRLAEFDLKSPPPPARAEAKAAVEIKAPGEPKATPADPKSSAESKAAAEAKPAADAKPAVEAKQPSSVFGATLRFKGELRADEDFTLQGRIEGSIHHTQNLTIGTDGVVKGDSRARNIIVDGTVDGDLYALEAISIRPTAKVQGNLMAPRVSIADGASFNGKVDMATAARAARTIADRQQNASAESTPLDEGTAMQVLMTGTGAQ
jgi:cytoskeletal protein CcmA (bactofilin family)